MLSIRDSGRSAIHSQSQAYLEQKSFGKKYLDIDTNTIRFCHTRLWQKKNQSFNLVKIERISEGISLAPVSNRSCDSAHPPSGSIFLLVYQKLFEAKISTVGGAFPAI